jgi:hypothetical protein
MKRIIYTVCLLVTLSTSLLIGISISRVQAHEEATSPNHSTAELIEHAFATNEISADERLLYFAYAIYEPASLPPEYKGHGRWESTPYLREIHNVQRDGKRSSELLAELDRIIAQQVGGVCDKSDGPNNVDSKYFHINYDATKFQDGLTIQDYTNALDNSYEVMHNQYGMPKVPLCTDNDDDGTCDTKSNEWSKYPIQISDALEDGVLAHVTSSGSKYVGFVGDNANTSNVTETDSMASCMVLGYIYESNDSKGLLEGTIAHEYFHSVQYAYGDTDPEEDAMWYESTAAYMEDEIYDSRNTQYEYLYPTFAQQCLGEYANIPKDDTNGIYRNFIFFRYVAEHNGGANSSATGSGKDVIQQFFLGLGSGKVALTAYDDALKTKNTNLNDAFHNFAIASRFMKACPTASPYCYEEAASYKAYQNSDNPITDTGSVTAIGGNYNGNIKDHYALNWIGLPTAGPYKVTLQGATGGEFRVSIVADTGTGLDVKSFPAVVKGSESQSLNYMPPSGATSVVAVVTNQQKTASNPATCAANSYILTVGESTGADPTTTPTATSQPGTFAPVAYLPIIIKSQTSSDATPTSTSEPTAESTITPKPTTVTPTATAESTATSTATAESTATSTATGDAITNMKVDTTGAACSSENVANGKTWTLSYDYVSTAGVNSEFDFEADITFINAGANEGTFDYIDGFENNSSDGNKTGSIKMPLCVDASSATSAKVVAFIRDKDGKDISNSIDVSL